MGFQQPVSDGLNHCNREIHQQPAFPSGMNVIYLQTIPSVSNSPVAVVAGFATLCLNGCMFG